MSCKRISDGRGARSSRVLKMGGNESKPTSGSSYNPPMRPLPTRTTKAVPEKIPVWPKNSTRWKKLYDVYICSSEQDILYAKALLLYLQDQPESLRCFLPMRDMNPGGAIPTEMTDGAENSHCWIMLLTSTFLSDQWCQYQMHQFLTMAPHGNGRLIPVLVELSFEHYPKELKHMYGYRDAQGDQKMFWQLRKAIVLYLKNLKEEINSKDSESGLSTGSSLLGINSEVTNSQALEPSGDSSLNNSLTQGSTGDTSLRSPMTSEPTNITSSRCDINQENPGEKSQIMQEPASNTLELTSNASRRSSIIQMSTSSTSVKNSVNQEAICEAFLKGSYTKASTSNTSRIGSLNQESINAQSGSISITRAFTSEMPLTSPVTQVSTCDTFMSSPVSQESTNETYLRHCSPKPNMDHSLSNYEMIVSNTNTLAINCDTMESSTSTSISAEQTYAITRKVGSGSCKKTINMDCQSFESDIYTSSARSLTGNKGSSSLQSNIYSSCGGTQLIKDSETLQGDTYISCGETNAEINGSVDLQRDIYTSSRTKVESKEFQSFQNNIYTSCGGVKTESKNSGNDLYTDGGSQAVKRDTLSLLSNMYTSSGRSKDAQILQKDRHTSCDEIEAKKEDSKILPEDLSVSCGGMQTENVNSPSYQSDMYTSYKGNHAHMDFQSLQTDMYTSSNGNQTEKKASCNFQTDLYTSYRETHAELKNPQNLHGETNTSFCGNQASSKPSESLQSDIYTSSDGTQIVRKDFRALLSGTTAHTMKQNLSAIPSNLSTDCIDTQADDCSSCNLYASCTSAKALGSDCCMYHGDIDKSCISNQAVKPLIHRYRGDSSRPTNEAADKT